MSVIVQSESGRVVRKADGSFRICIVDEGHGDSADWPRDFFTPENAALVAGLPSFPSHPEDPEQAEYRNPMSIIGRVGKDVTIEEHDGKLGFWADFHPSKKPGVAEHLEEFGDILGVSIYSMGLTRHNESTGRDEVVMLDAEDNYRSVDVVIVPGRGGRFEKRLAESHRRLSESTSAPAGGNEQEEETRMDKDIEARFDAFEQKFESALKTLADTLKGKADADAQAKVNEEAVTKAVDEALADYDKAVDLISEAQLTESQSSDLRARARKGEDISGAVETAKKVLAEAASRGGSNGGTIPHLGGGGTSGATITFEVPGFGKAVI